LAEDEESLVCGDRDFVEVVEAAAVVE